MSRHASPIWTRRTMLFTFGAVAGAVLARCNTASTDPTSDADAAGTGTDAALSDDATSNVIAIDGGTCVLDPNVTKGPYWVDGQLNRSDVLSDTSGSASPNPRPGLPLTLNIRVLAYGTNACSPLPNAQIDIWHADASGVYSDANNMGGENTVGQNFLRGYQMTDANGLVSFSTIFPGWYSGRTIHIHVKIRIFDASRNTTTEATTQLFIDDSLTDTVMASAAPYNTRGTRDTRNADDMIYGGHAELLLGMQGDATSGYTATATLGIQVGELHAG